MNTLSAHELKRHGVGALEKLLKSGPVHILKNNRPTCVVLSEEEYDALRSRMASEGRARLSVLELLSQPAAGHRTREEIDADLRAERDNWDRQ